MKRNMFGLLGHLIIEFGKTYKIFIYFIILVINILVVFSCKEIIREPKVETGVVTDVTINSAVATGNIIDVGDGIIDYGHCWSTTTNPLINTFKTSFGTISRTGSYTSILQSLEPGTKYYIKAYAKNANDEVYYGGESSFITNAISLPTITTTPVTSITSTTAISGGDVTSDGGAAVTARGVCYSTNSNPTVSLSTKTINGSGTGLFTSTITGLSANTTYHVRGYATNSIGTAYGEQMIFSTYGVIDIDGNGYKTVTIGTQLWIAENLKTTKYNDGTNIPLVTDNAEWGNLPTHAYCWYDNDENTYKNVYGALYNLYAVNTGKLCPVGWHVPSDAEWTTLTNYLGGESVAGGKLKSNGTIEEGNGLWYSPNAGATNETGFTAVPGGDRDGNGTFLNIGFYGVWWSSTEFSPMEAWFRYVGWNYSDVDRDYIHEALGFSVRCVRN